MKCCCQAKRKHLYWLSAGTPPTRLNSLWQQLDQCFTASLVLKLKNHLENLKHVTPWIISLQWHLMDCWIKVSGRRKQQQQEWEVSVPSRDAMFSFLPHYLVSLTYMQWNCRAAAFISAPSRDYGSMQSYELCMGDAPWYVAQPPPTHSQNFLFIIACGTRPQSITRHMHGECISADISKRQHHTLA